MQSIYSSEKVNNEIELCEINDTELKAIIEKEFLKNRISYFVRFLKPSVFRRNKNTCVICVNDNSKETAEEVIRAICDDKGYNVKFLFKKSQNDFL